MTHGHPTSLAAPSAARGSICVCGKDLGRFPTAEDAADALMQHAYEHGILDQRASRGV